MPTIFDLLDRLSALRGAPAVFIVLVAAYVAVAAWNLRPAMAAYGVQVLVSGLLFVDLLAPRLAILHWIIGIFVALILTVTAAQIGWKWAPPAPNVSGETGATRPSVITAGRLQIPGRAVLRIVLATLALVAAWRLGGLPEYQFPLIPASLSHLYPAIYGLAGLGLAAIVTSSDPIFSGIGLLLFLEAFALFYSALDQSLASLITPAAAGLITALAIAYLAQAHRSPPEALE